MIASKQTFYILILQIVAMQLMFANPSSSQSLEATKIAIHVKNVALTEVFDVIEKQSPFVFTYQDKYLNQTETYSFSYEKIALGELLMTLAEQGDLQFKRINNNISVKKAVRKTEATERVIELDRSIQGIVKDSESGEPLIGATVQVKGTTIGTITDIDGRFSLSIPDNQQVLVISFIGFESKELNVTEESNVTITLRASRNELSEVVVTALGIEKDKRSIVSSVQELNGDDLSESRETNMMNNLSGKIAGLDIQRSSAGLSGSVRAVIRGESSLNLNKNQPLFIVNGVPINNQITPSGSGNYGGSDLTIDYGNGAAEINPDDVESISVLKGPSAAALYGSRAANGVIMITTKSGKGTKGIGVSVNSNTTFNTILKLPDYQNEYGAGSVAQNDYYSYGASADGPSTANSGHNWGPKFMGQEFVQYGSPLDENGNRIPIAWEAHPDNVKDFFETGRTLNNNIAIEGHNDQGNFRLSYTNLDQTGTYPNTELKRNLLSLTTGYKINKKLSVNANVNYVKSNSDNLPNSGYGASSPMYAFIWFERNADINWLNNYWAEGQEGVKQSYFHTWADNPYFVAYEHLNSLNKNRTYGNISLTYKFNDALKLILRSGTDYSYETRTSKRPYSSVGLSKGRYRTQDVYFNEVNTDFLLSYGKTISNDWDFTVSVGGNRMKQTSRNNVNDATQLTIPNVYNMGNAAGFPIIDEYNAIKEINSLYGTGEIAFRQYLFLNVTGRNDWSSTLPLDNNSYFYPSVGLSAIISDMFDLENSPISYGKMRLSWAQVGNDTDPYRLNNTYNYGALSGSVNVPSSISNSSLKPEIASSYEIGADVRFFENRLGVDITYYNMISTNQIINVQIPVTSGYTSKVLNAGEIKNQGLEIILRGTPVKTSDFSWDITANFAQNRSEVVELIEGIDNYIIASAGMGTVEARVGGRMGDIYGQKLERSPDGQVIYKDGIPQVAQSIEKLGNYNPDWMGGISNTLQYKDLYFGISFDTKQGGEIVSLTHAAGSESGILPHTLAGRETGIVGNGVVDNGDGTYSPNTINVSAPSYYRSMYHRSVTESHTFDASFVKLREIKIGYKLPKSLLSATPFKAASVSIVGRNLALWTNVPHIDPETTTIKGNSIIPGFEVTQLPSTRSIGFNLNFKF